MQKNKIVKMSPLYTPPAEEVRKKEIIKRIGRDKDGAYRVGNRIDREG